MFVFIDVNILNNNNTYISWNNGSCSCVAVVVTHTSAPVIVLVCIVVVTAAAGFCVLIIHLTRRKMCFWQPQQAKPGGNVHRYMTQINSLALLLNIHNMNVHYVIITIH